VDEFIKETEFVSGPNLNLRTEINRFFSRQEESHFWMLIRASLFVQNRRVVNLQRGNIFWSEFDG
jgi:hypothetical protein